MPAPAGVNTDIARQERADGIKMNGDMTEGLTQVPTLLGCQHYFVANTAGARSAFVPTLPLCQHSL